MREHEVPTHVQAEDKALLWFTFPQIVAVVAVCAVSYGVYRYFPFGPAELRLGLAILLGITGVALTVGKVGGRGLPLVAADLLKFKLGARRYAGSPAQLTSSEPPQQPDASPGPLQLLLKKAVNGARKFQEARRSRKASRTFRPHRWLGRRRRSREVSGRRGGESHGQRRKYPFLAVAALGLLSVVALPTTALADDPDDNPYDDAWRLEEIYFQPPAPAPGRRVFIERLAVAGDTASVTLRAAHGLDLRVRVYGGEYGETLKMGFNTSLAAGQIKSYNLTLDGPAPSITFSWRDAPVSSTGQALGRSGAVSLKNRQIPYPLPRVDGELCDLELTSLEWVPGEITGAIAATCIAETRHEEALPVYAGHYQQTVPALLDATVTSIAGSVSVKSGSHRATTNFVPNGETAFTLAVPDARVNHRLEITADLTATLNVPRPPMLHTTSTTRPAPTSTPGG